MGITLSKDSFEQDVLKSEIPYLVDFWAPWCGPCKVLTPILDEIAAEYQGRCKFGTINVDDNNDLAMKYGVMSLPTLKIFKQGKVIGEIIGAAPKQLIISNLNGYLE